MNDFHVLYIERPLYKRVLNETLESASIKVLTGIRRCGKSTILKMFMRELESKGVPEDNLLYMRMDSFETPLEPDAAWLDDKLRLALDISSPSYPTYFFLDEIQDVENWERPIRRLYESGRARIYLTGSNASLLSSDLATYLSGRYIEIPIFPLSFKEFRDFQKAYHTREQQETPDSFSTYLRYGGMPGLFGAHAHNEESAIRELSAIRDTVLLNDVAKRFNIRDIDLLEKLLRYIYSTSGNLFSANKVASTLTSMGRKTNAETVDNYINALEKAFALYNCPQTGLKGKKILAPQRKYYSPDNGLRNLASGFGSQDIGFQIEGVVYMELLRRGYKVFVGALPSGEVDFVAERLSERLYIQVCENIVSDETFLRELAPLEAIGDSHTKMVLTRDDIRTGITDSGIRIESLVDWLLK